MNNHPCHRHLAYLVISAQLLGCSAGPGNAAQQNDVWAPSPAPSANEAPMRPHFTAPSARNCARPMQMREVPAGQHFKRDSDGLWPSLMGKLGRSSERRSDALSDDTSVRARAEASTSLAAAPAAPAAPAARIDSKDFAAPVAEAKVAAAQHNRTSATTPAMTTMATVTAGVVDDNANFGEYLAFRNRTQVAHRPVDVSERYLLQVRDRSGRSVPDAEVRIQSPNGAAMWARTDAGGQVWVSPNAFDTSHASTYQVNVRKPDRWGTAYAPYIYGTGFLQRGQKSAIDITLDASSKQSTQRAQLDLVDATGSMGDEIDKLKASMHTIAAEVARLPARPDLCFGLVAYRDYGDEFLIRSHDFTNDLGSFQNALNRLQANGGGDYPEALNEALHDTVHNLSWRGDGTTRMVFLIADAPPHLDYSGPQYDTSMTAALGKGIKIFSVGASGLDKQGEYIQRQLAQYTGGKFVFLTYDQAHNPASGPGRETVHDVQNYGVDTLDRLIVRLVREDLARLAQ